MGWLRHLPVVGVLSALLLHTPSRHWALRRVLLDSEELIAKLLGPVHDAGDKYLKGHYQPVPGHLTGQLRKELRPLAGQPPADLQGMYLRNGPNNALPVRGGYHIFDGDGMMHVFRLKGDGFVSYFSDYIRTPRFEVEQLAGETLYMRLGGMMTGKPSIMPLVSIALDKLRRLLGAVPDIPDLEGCVNTAVVHHAHRVYGLCEASYPFELAFSDNGTFKSRDFERFHGQLKHGMTAHPKVDPDSGELVFFFYDIIDSKVWHSVVSAEGTLVSTVKVSLTHPVMIHDMLLTPKWSVLLDLPLRFSGEKAVTDGSVFHFDKDAPAQILLVPRHATSEDQVWRVALPAAFHTFHTVAAWEQGDDLTLFVTRSEDFSLIDIGRNYEPKLWRLDVRLPLGGESAKFLHEQKLSPQSSEFLLEFPVVNPNYLTRAGWSWISVAKKGADGFHGIQKWNLKQGSLDSEVDHGEGTIAGEAVFAHKEGQSNGEDDGYLVVLLHNQTTWQTLLAVYEAKSLQRVSMTPMPHHIPFGFHGLWVTETEVQALRK